jgi:hypothetical protein
MKIMDEEPIPPPDFLWPGFDDFIGNLARIFAHGGNAAAVAVLSEGKAHLHYKSSRLIFGPDCDYQCEVFDAWLSVPHAVFNSAIDRVDTRRIEPDFVIFDHGILMAIELNGPFHTETPVKADERIAILSWQGQSFCESTLYNVTRRRGQSRSPVKSSKTSSLTLAAVMAH